MIALRKYLTAALATMFPVICWAQTNVLDSDPIAARKRLVYSQLGGYTGVGANSQGGTFTTQCNCEFTGGGGAGFMIGAQFERLTRSTLTWGATLGYEGRSITARFRETEGVVQTSPSGRQFTVPVTFLHEADMSLNVLNFTPYLKYAFFENFFVRLGGSVGYVFSSNITHIKNLESTSITFPNGENATVSVPGAESGSVELENGPVSDISALQIGLVPAIGMDIRLSKRFFMAPVMQYLVPLTTISAQGNGFSVRSFQISLELRHIL